MSYLLDTCIVSKLRKMKTEQNNVLRLWLSSHSEINYYLSVLTIGEIQTGISKLNVQDKDENRKKMIFEEWLSCELIPRFKNRILSFDSHTASIWGTMKGQALKQGINLPVIDSLIAATALQHDLVLVTENVKDFKYTSVHLINPLDAERALI